MEKNSTRPPNYPTACLIVSTLASLLGQQLGAEVSVKLKEKAKHGQTA